MRAIDNDNQRPSAQTWDAVAEDYALELTESDYELAREIEKIFRKIGIHPGMRILELGSGSGHLSACLAQFGFNVTLLDFSNKAIEKAQGTFNHYGLTGEFILADIFDLSEITQKFDLVWNSGVMEHFSDEDFVKILQSVHQVSQNAQFLFIVPNPNSRAYLMMRYNHHSRNSWAYGKEYLYRDYIKLCNQAGFKVVASSYCCRDISNYLFTSTFSDAENCAIYSNMMDAKLMPEDEQYLVAYALQKKRENGMSEVNAVPADTTIPDYHLETVLELRAQVFGAQRQLSKAENALLLLHQEMQQELEALQKAKDIELATLMQAKDAALVALQQEKDTEIAVLAQAKDDDLTKLKRIEHELAELKDASTIAINENKRLRSRYLQEKAIAKQQQLLLEEYQKKDIEARAFNEELQAKNHELTVRIQGLLAQKTAVIAKLHAMTRSKLFKLVHLLNRIKRQAFHKSLDERKKFRKWLLSRPAHLVDEDHRYNPLFQPIEMLKEENTAVCVSNESHMERTTETTVEIPNCWGSGILAEYLQSQTLYFAEVRREKISKNAKKVKEIINSSNYKGILVYPHIVYWEPLQTPQQLLRAFAQEGWLCFFCDNPYQKDVFREVEPNLWICHEADLVQALEDTPVTVLLTWMGSMAFLKELKNRKIWYHILDHLEIFSRYDELYQKLHDASIDEVELVSYVARPLAQCAGRTDAIYLPNGAHAAEIANIHEGFVPLDMKDILAKKHKIIGYYGYLAEWMDYQMIHEMALARPNYEFVFIGKAVHDTSLIDTLPNVHLLGLKKYQELSDYAKFFDVATIPFVVDEKMDCVSPIKFYEYLALGLPVVSSVMPELIPFAEKYSFVECADGREQFLACVDKLLDANVQTEAKKEAPRVAEANSWIARAQEMEKHLLF